MSSTPPETTTPIRSRRVASLRSVTALEPLSVPVFRLLWSTWLTANLCMWMTDVAAAWTMRWGLAVSAMGHTGQSEAIHWPDAWASIVVKLTKPRRLVDRGAMDGGDLMLTERLAHDVEATRQRGIAEGALSLPCPSVADRGGQ